METNLVLSWSQTELSHQSPFSNWIPRPAGTPWHSTISRSAAVASALSIPTLSPPARELSWVLAFAKVHRRSRISRFPLRCSYIFKTLSIERDEISCLRFEKFHRRRAFGDGVVNR